LLLAADTGAVSKAEAARRNVVKISKADDGGYKAIFYFIDQSADGFTASKATLDGPTLKMSLPLPRIEGKVSPDGKTNHSRLDPEIHLTTSYGAWIDCLP
jgi:hypothetical protein